MRETIRKFVGIDLAGDSGSTGVAIIHEQREGSYYYFPEGNWKGVAGLGRLAKLVNNASQTAVDQPFSYSKQMMFLLLASDDAIGTEKASKYSTRRTDKYMRNLLGRLGLNRHYVVSPNRCQNIWRALALAKHCGLTRKQVCNCTENIIETHPRVAWARLLSNLHQNELQTVISNYKGTGEYEVVNGGQKT